MQRKFVDGAVVADSRLGDRQIRVVANSGRPDRAGDVLVASGCDTANYGVNSVVLADHDPSLVIGNFTPTINGSALEGIITFAPLGVSAKADEFCRLYKAGVMRALSVGFAPIEREPLPDGGSRYTKWELLELSCVAVPCDPSALVIARSYLAKSGRVLNSTNSAAIAQVMSELDKCETAHFNAASLFEKSDLHRSRALTHARAAAGSGDDVETALGRVMRELDKSADAHANAADFLEKSDRHRATAARHAATIAASASDQPADGDYADPDDGDGDVELSLSRDRRRRLIEIASRAHGPSQSGAEDREGRSESIADQRSARERRLLIIDAADVGHSRADPPVMLQNDFEHAAKWREDSKQRMEAVWRA